MTTHDPINHPRHYTGHPSGIEDLRKAAWYVQREIDRRRTDQEGSQS